MIAPIRRVGLGIITLLGLLVGQLTYVHLVRAEELNEDPANIRLVLRDFARGRGPIVTADGVVIARTVTVDDDIGFQREYPFGGLYAHLTGFQSLRYGLTGLERTYDSVLLGRSFDLQFGDIGSIFTAEDPEGTLRITVDSRAQTVAREALDGRRGSVVVLDVQTGGVVAMFSNPSYDPNLIATHDPNAAEAFFDAFNDDPSNPMRSRAYRERFPAGSTFKVVTTGIALDSGVATADRVFPELTELELPLTDRTLSNFGGNRCGGTLAESFRNSCNTTFGQLGLDLGEQLAIGIERFGLNTSPPAFDLDPETVRSIGPERGTFKAEAPLFAQAAIGQGAIAVTPLDMAMIAQAVANGGVMLAPHMMTEIENERGEVVERYAPVRYSVAMTPATAATVTEMMIDVVNNGTGTAAQIPGVQVAGKTGTAQLGDRTQPPHAWFVGFAPAAAPRYAIAVIVENGGDLGSEATGGRVAAPVAATVLSTILSQPAA
jgi:peptidoglycan glycosyltransferase